MSRAEEIRNELWDFVDARWDGIERFVKEQLVEGMGYIEGDVLPPIEDLLGHGQLGFVWNTAFPEWNVKITTDAAEAAYVQQIYSDHSLHVHPGTAFFLGVWHIGGFDLRGQGFDVFLILREDMRPLSEDDLVSPEYAEPLDLLDNSTYEAAVLVRWATGVTPDADVDDEEVEYEDVLEKLADIEETAALSRFLSLFFEIYGYPITDAHSGNVGFHVHDLQYVVDRVEPEPQDLALYDFGYSSVRSEDIPHIRPNPAIPRVRL